MLTWRTPRTPFCEGIIDGAPELINSVTSLAMLFYGLAGLFISHNHNMTIRIISATLAVTGIGSTIYHYTLFSGWGQVDGLPMLISSYLGAHTALDAVIYKRIAIDYDDHDRYETMSSILSLVVMVGLSFSLALSAIEETEQYFSVLFLIPELGIAIGALLIRLVSHYDLNDEGMNRAFKHMYIGVGVSVTAAIFWAVTENLCPTYTWMRYLFAHGFWHVGISVGMYFLMQFLVYTHSHNKNKAPYWKTGDSTVEKIFYKMVPSVRHHL